MDISAFEAKTKNTCRIKKEIKNHNTFDLYVMYIITL